MVYQFCLLFVNIYTIILSQIITPTNKKPLTPTIRLTPGFNRVDKEYRQFHQPASSRLFPILLNPGAILIHFSNIKKSRLPVSFKLYKLSTFKLAKGELSRISTKDDSPGSAQASLLRCRIALVKHSRESKGERRIETYSNLEIANLAN